MFVTMYLFFEIQCNYILLIENGMILYSKIKNFTFFINNIKLKFYLFLIRKWEVSLRIENHNLAS